MQENWFILDLETSWLNRFSGFGAGEADPVEAFRRAAAGPDFSSSRFFAQHHGSQLLEAAFHRPMLFARPAGNWGGFSDRHLQLAFQGAPFRLSRFSQNLLEARSGGVFTVAGRPGTEEEAGRLLFRSLHRRLRRGPVVLAGWNPAFDLSFLESLAWRYPRLSHWRGWMARQMEAGRLQVVGLEQALLDLVWAWGEANPRFRQKFYLPHFGRLAASPAELRRLPIWSIENVLAAATGGAFSGFQSHTARADVVLEESLYRSLRRASALAGQAGWDEALRQAGLISADDTAALFFHRLFRSVRTDAPLAARLRSLIPPEKYPPRVLSRWLLAAAAGAGAALALWQAWSDRRSRQTQLEGLQERGLAKLLRASLTSFGSGWQGLEEEPSRIGWMASAAGAALARGFAFRALSDLYPELPRMAWQMARTAEWLSPAQLLRVAGLSRSLSSYLPASIVLDAGHLVSGGLPVFASGAQFALSQMGQHLQGLLGPGVRLEDLLRQGQGQIEFVRARPGDPWMRMRVAGQELPYRVRFLEAGSRTAVSSWMAGLRVPETPLPAGATLAERYRAWRQARVRTGYFAAVWIDPETGRQMEQSAASLAGRAIRLQPYQALRDGDVAGNLLRRIHQGSFQLLERTNRLLNEIGLGLRPGTYGGPGELFGRLMLRRVLPAALLWTGLRYADYLTGHVVSDAAYDLYAKARIAHAELTDRVPGWRRAVEWNREHLPGPSYAPLAIPAAGAATGALLHWLRVASGRIPYGEAVLRRTAARRWTFGGAAIGALLAAPLLPGMLGSRRTAEQWRRVFRGDEEVEVRSGRWWDLGSGPLRGRRILMRRPHRYVLHKTRASIRAVYGSEEEYWSRHPLLHPLRWLRDPYWLERKHYFDRPYPVTSPAFSDVPIVGPLLAATIGRLVKPPRLMHEGEWDPQGYQLFSDRLERSRTRLLPPAPAAEEYRLGDALARTWERLEDLVGLPGFLFRSLRKRAGLTLEQSDRVYLAGSRQMTSLARRYYEQELGSMTGLSAGGDLFGYSEPLRRFVQRDDQTLQVNDIPNRMPDWLPGSDYFINFRTGDPYVKIPQGELRLPGPGYEALHPHLAGVDPKDYPLLDRLAILADVAPWSRQYFRMEKLLDRMQLDPADRVRFERIRAAAERIRSSTASTETRLSGPATAISGTVESAGPEGVRLREYPGRLFRWSGLDLAGAGMSAEAIGERNRSLLEAAARRRRRAAEIIAGRLRPGRRVQLMIEPSALGSEEPRAVFFAGGVNVNRLLVDEGLARMERQLAGPEWTAAEPAASRWLTRYGEALLMTGRKAWYNPLRWIPWIGHGKLADAQDALERYRREERMELDRKRWDRPVRDILAGWWRGLRYRLTGQVQPSAEVAERDELERLVDYIRYLQGLRQAASGDRRLGRQLMSSTIVGGNLTGDPARVRRLLGRDARYFDRFVGETDPERQREILESASPRLAEALMAQWAARIDRLRQAEGRPALGLVSGGRYMPEEKRRQVEEEARRAGIEPADAVRAREIARFFAARGLRMPLGDPDAERALLDPAIDPEDVKVKILQWEGRDLHDFHVYRDREALLWRKPWLDGAVRTLTSGDSRSEDEMRKAIEKAMAEAGSGGRRSESRGAVRPSRDSRRRIVVEVREDSTEELRRELRRHRDRYAA